MNVPRIIGIYLAAGKSARMGTDKLTLPFAGKYLGSVALKTALHSHLHHVIVVAKEGDSLDWIAPELFTSKKWSIVSCSHSSYGQAHSLICGLKQAIQLQAKAVIVLLADQPFVTKTMINELLFHYKLHPAPYITFTNQGIPMPPTLFSAKTFSGLLQLTGDEGARKLIRERWQGKGRMLEYKDPDIFFDIDTKEDYLLAIDKWERKRGIRV
jgi:molybdenum cofactor cytidylyltransferase